MKGEGRHTYENGRNNNRKQGERDKEVDKRKTRVLGIRGRNKK